MNAPISTDEISVLMPASISRRDGIATRDALAQRGQQTGSWLARAITWIVTYPQRRAAVAELSSLSDRELSDIGLRRAEISSVFSLRHPR